MLCPCALKAGSAIAKTHIAQCCTSLDYQRAHVCDVCPACQPLQNQGMMSRSSYTCLQGYPYEPLPLLKHQIQCMWARQQGFLCPSHS